MADDRIRVSVAAIAAMCVLGGGAVWLLTAPASRRPSADPAAAEPDAGRSGEASPGARGAAVPGSPPGEVADASEGASAKDLRPAGERLRPGAAPGAGQPFLARTRAGAQARGLFFRAKAAAAPLLVFMGEPLDRPDAWHPVLRTLRESRDYHLAVVTPPPTKTDPAVRIESSREIDVLEAALTWTQQTVGQRGGGARAQTINGVGLIGGGRGGAAAVLLAAERRDVLAAVAISAPPRLGRFRLSDALPRLRGRHTHWLAATDDERSVGTLGLARGLPLAVVRTRPGADRGAQLLAADRRAQTSLAGWLFSVMPLAQ